MICVSIGRTRHKMVLAELAEAAKRGAQLIELRLDFLARPPDLKRLLAAKQCPLVVTIRRPADGGRWSHSEAERHMLLRQAIVSGGFEWVDLELDIADQIRRFGNVKRIISYHNIKEMPENLEAIHEHMCQLDPDVVKLAVKADKPSDNLRVLRLMSKAQKPTIAICMGDLGVPSRILAGKFGAPFTYAAFNKERGIAPGILGFDDTRKIFNYDHIYADSRVYGVIGDPVEHSLSPLIHNAAFRALNMNCVYVPFRVPRGELAAFLKEFAELPVHGFSVTIPHKEHAAALAKEKDADVDMTQAANTLVLRPDGTYNASNTDCVGAVESLRTALAGMEGQHNISGRSILILGAGGVARAVAHSLHREGAILIVCNRTPEKAHQLAAEVGCRAIDWAARHSVLCDTIINCTSVGMEPDVDASPVHHSFLKQGLIVFDTVYTPETTLLVREARERGCIVLTGVDMFVRQAAQQFRLFSGEEAPVELMRKIIKKALSPVLIQDEEPAK